MKALLTLLVACLGLAAFAQTSSWNSQPGVPAVNYVQVATGTNSRITNAEQRIISSDSDWAKLYAMMAGYAQADPNRTPKVCDFNKQDLIVIHAGLKRTLGYKVYVSTISRPNMNQKVVEVMMISPAPGSVNAQEMNSPYVVIAVDRSPGNYQFKYTNSTASTTTNLAGGCGCCGECHCNGSCCSGGNNGNGGVFIYKNGQLERHPNDQPGGGTYRYANGAMIPVEKGGGFLPPKQNQNGQQSGGQGNNQSGHGRDNKGGKGGGQNGG